MTVAVGVAALAPAVAGAANYTVTSLADSGANSLRAALANTNADNADDTISFSGAASSGTIRLASPLTISEGRGLTLKGPGRNALAISGDTNGDGTADVHILDVTAPDANDAAVTLSGLTLTRGTTTGNGGAISETGTMPLVLTDAAVTNSSATGSDSHGGGIATSAPLTLTRTLLTGNTTAGDGGGLYGSDDVTIDGGTISQNIARDGGGLLVVGGGDGGGSLTVRDATITGNQAKTQGGGLDAEFIGRVDIQRTTISANKVTPGAGGGLVVSPVGDATIANSLVTGNTASGPGGGAVMQSYGYGVVAMRNTNVTGNKASDGAGVFVGGLAGRFVIDGSTISGNGGGSTVTGGGVTMEGGDAAFQLQNSTITANTATKGGALAVGNGDGEQILSPVEVDNSTIVGNSGGGIFLNSFNAGSPAVRRSASIGLNSTIVAGNGTDTDRADDATAGTIDAASSLIQKPGDAPLASTSTAVITGQDPLLGALADNGGPTKTMLPAGTSPVLDAGRAPASLKFDQRGLTRTVDSGLANQPFSDGTDMGAVELPASSVFVPAPLGPPSAPPPAAPEPVFSVAAGAQPITPGTPLLPASVTPFSCAVTVVKLTRCDVAIRSLTPIRLDKRHRLPAGTLLGEAQPASAAGAPVLQAKAVLTSEGEAALATRPTGLDAQVVAVGTYTGTDALTTTGRVHLFPGPTVTLALGTSSSLSASVKAQLHELAGLLAGAERVSVNVTGPSKRAAATLAVRARGELQAAGLKIRPSTSGTSAKTRGLKITFVLEVA